MLKSLAILSSLAVSALCSANAFAMTRAEAWYWRYSQEGRNILATGYVPDDMDGSWRAAERDLAAHGEDKPNLSKAEGADLVRDCITNTRNVARFEKVVVGILNAATGKKFENDIVAGLIEVVDGMNDFDARLCLQKLEDAGKVLPDNVQRRFFPERYDSSLGGSSSSGCFGAGGCPN